MPMFAGFGLKLLGFLKAIPPMVWVAIAVAAALGLLIHDRNNWKAKADDRGAKLVTICQATRDAAGKPKLDCGQAALQIKYLGQAVGTLRAGIARQNAAVASLGAETARQQADAAQARKAAEKRASKAESASERLLASARSSERQTKPCEPSKALEGAWR